MIIAKTSVAKLNKRSDKGSPYLRLRLDCILFLRTPLTIMLELPILRRDIIQPIHLKLKPRATNISLRKSQSIESKAFAKSSFKSAHVILFLQQ